MFQTYCDFEDTGCVCMKEKRFKLVLNCEYDIWELYDSEERRYYDVDITDFQKEYERLERNHHNLHEKYEKLEEDSKETRRKYSSLKGNKDSIYRIYLNLKNIYENDDV